MSNVGGCRLEQQEGRELLVDVSGEGWESSGFTFEFLKDSPLQYCFS